MHAAHDHLHLEDALPYRVMVKRVAIVHEWIDAYAGSEQVFEALAQTFPTADLFALTRRPDVDLSVGDRPIRTTFLDIEPLRSARAAALPLMPLAWRSLGRGDYDLVISSHHAFAHANRLAGAHGNHLAYVHSPARYIWSPEIDSRGSSALLVPARKVLKRIDRAASSRVHRYAANSREVASRLKEYWGRESTIISPPARVDYFTQGAEAAKDRTYALAVGRWIKYKNFPQVIRAADIAGIPVKIAGSGPDKERIAAAAGQARVRVEIIENPSDAELRALYQGARCLVFPTVEDFGIVPVEAQAAGTPVVAIAQGGALDTVVHGVTGYLTDGSETQLAQGIQTASQLKAADCVENSRRFSVEAFRANIIRWVDER